MTGLLCNRDHYHDESCALGPRVPSTYTHDNDVNPICGHHLRSNCDGCGVCTACDGCYCGED